MKLALAQIRSKIADFKENSSHILDYVHRAKDHSCDLVVFPELSLMGYNPYDLLERHWLIEEQGRALKDLHKKLPPSIAVLIGAVTPNEKKSKSRPVGKPFFNSALLLKKNVKPRIFSKTCLPSYDVFDDSRFFDRGKLSHNFFTLSGHRFLVAVCEDMWSASLVQDRYLYETDFKFDINSLYLDKKLDTKVDGVIVLNASPFTVKKISRRQEAAQAFCKRVKAPLYYCNRVGGQDEVIFDGGSFVMSSSGQVVDEASYFKEDLLITETDSLTKISRLTSGKAKSHSQRKVLGQVSRKLSRVELIREALVLGLSDFVRGSGFTKVHFGLSGGIDSAVVACLAVQAMGRENVTAIALPGPFSSKESLTSARKLSENLGIKLKEASIVKGYEEILRALEPLFGNQEFGVMHENLQARVRALVLMAVSNKENSFLLGTSNKSELATGYSTLYGDLCAGLQPIGDLVKTDVYALAALFNERGEGLIPAFIIERPPSAELRPDQKDQDSLPEYHLLDKSIVKIVEENKKPSNPTDGFVLQALNKSEFKRWQAPPILKVTERSFGRGRRYPLVARR